MKTLSDFKRELTVGSKWISTVLPGARFKTWGKTDKAVLVRTVTRVQSNGVWFSLEDKESFLEFGKASKWSIEPHKATLKNIHGEPMSSYEKYPL